MTTRVGINGFGRIGRLCLRTLLQRCKGLLSVVAVNDMADLETNAHLFQYDSTYGIFPGTVEVGEGILRVDGRNITILNEKDPSRLPWKNLGVDLVIESTGVFNDGLRARLQICRRKMRSSWHATSVSASSSEARDLRRAFAGQR